MIHCKGDTEADVLERAKREIDIYRTNGVDGVLVETYFGTYHNVEQVLGYLQKEQADYPYGINCLNVDALASVLVSVRISRTIPRFIPENTVTFGYYDHRKAGESENFWNETGRECGRFC